MNDSTSQFTDELKHDLHGEQVGRRQMLVCDYCGAGIDITEPVMYEALRVVDMPNLEQLLDLPEDWILDAARCRNCETETLEPATEGFDEALLLISITESDGFLSADTSQMTVVDTSPEDEGYYPPQIEAKTLVGTNDPGYARWIRMKSMLDDLESSDVPATAAEPMRESIRQSKDVPPNINV